MPFISIIVPVYNTERYLLRCVESVLNQNFSDFELLLINDGSSDKSGVICDACANKDSRVRVFHKKNGGVSSARNQGIDSAHGEWLYFVDSDDELLPNGLQTLVECISDDVDIAMGGFVEVNESGGITGVDKRALLSLTKKQSIVSLYGGYGFYYHYCGYLWMRLLRKSVIQKFNLRFDSSIAIKEDTLFLMQYICRSNGITRQTTTPVYVYCRRADSAMGKVEHGFEPKYIDSFFALVEMKHEIDELYPFYSDLVFIAKQAIFGRFYIILNMMNTNRVYDERLKNELSLVMHHEVGSVLLFKIRRKIRKIFRKAKNYQQENHV